MLPLPHSAGRCAGWQVPLAPRSQHKRARTIATRPNEPGHAKLNFGSAGGLSCRMLPGSRTRDVIYNAAHCRIPLAREPSAIGFPPSPRATTRPTARFIEDNIVLCGPRLRRCHADCFPPSPAARHRPWRGSPRASLQASFTPAVRCRRWVKIWRGQNPQPRPPRMLAPSTDPGGSARITRVSNLALPGAVCFNRQRSKFITTRIQI